MLSNFGDLTWKPVKAGTKDVAVCIGFRNFAETSSQNGKKVSTIRLGDEKDASSQGKLRHT
jgi:hypothetical protein